MEKREKFWMEACALREAGSHEAGKNSGALGSSFTGAQREL